MAATPPRQVADAIPRGDRGGDGAVVAEVTSPYRQRVARIAPMRIKVVACVAGLALGLGACGSSAPGSSSSSGAGRAWTAAQLLRLAGIRRNADLTYRLAGHPNCATTNLLRSTAEVDSYKGSGDVIITNPDGSAGVKANGASATCRRLFAQALAKVR
jgi:hypothetical protein